MAHAHAHAGLDDSEAHTSPKLVPPPRENAMMGKANAAVLLKGSRLNLTYRCGAYMHIQYVLCYLDTIHVRDG